LDVLSRSSRKLVKAIDHAINEYMLTHEQEPTNEELADMLGESVDKIHEARIASDIYTVMPLQDQLQIGDEGAALAKIEKDDLIDKIQQVLSTYKEREQMIIQLYYFEELTLKEISEILDITESRISQIHKSVIKNIRDSVGV
ncbi:MAG: sigma-70 family RNA polymerase sigma factor, partial [Campylobacterales bacterium]|nr:sigma-70 family RNA polymerase sigma factor [Campylobacterales bacterium]